MATIITNQATLNYRYGTVAATAVSNVTTSVLNSQLNIRKTSITEEYRIGQNIVYIISLENNSNNAINNIRVSDNLGTYILNGNEVTPLDYTGTAQLFVNGSFVSNLTADADEHQVSFVVPSIPANGNAQIIYQTTVNEYANGESGSEITNTATADDDCDCPCDEPVSDSHTITAEDFADVRVVKSVCPNPVICGGELRYVFDIYNYGNIPATEVVLTDTFNPELTDIAVYVDGTLIPAEDYSYVDGTLTLPSAGSDYEITIPAATFSQNTETGLITVTPAHIQVIVTGTV